MCPSCRVDPPSALLCGKMKTRSTKRFVVTHPVVSMHVGNKLFFILIRFLFDEKVRDSLSAEEEARVTAAIGHLSEYSLFDVLGSIAEDTIIAAAVTAGQHRADLAHGHLVAGALLVAVKSDHSVGAAELAVGRRLAP